MLNRFCEAYPDDARLQEELALPGFEDSLVRVGPGYSGPLRICRLDAFLAGDQVKFLEFNADSPAGIGYTDVLHEGLRQAISLPGVDREFDTAYEPMLPLLVGTLLDAYREMRAARAGGPELPETPRLALVDVPGSPSIPEFRIICAAAAEAGVEAIHVTTDELSYDGSVLRAGGEPVQLVYRRALVDDLTEGDLTAAYRDGAACVVNPPRARVANNKKLMALLDDPRFAHLVEPREAEVIAATIPWTRVLRPGRVTYGQWTIDLLDFVSDNRARLVLKPASEYGGHDVALGMETEQDAWDRIISEQAESRRLHRPGVRPGARGDVPDGRGRPRADAPEALQHQPVRDRRALRGDDHPDLRPGGDQRLGRRRAAAERGRPPQAAFARRAGRGSGGGSER